MSTRGERRAPVRRLVSWKVVVVVVVAAIAAGWLLAGLHRVPEGAVGIRNTLLRGEEVLSPGLCLAAPGLGFVRVFDPYRREGELIFQTREGARLELRVRLAVRLTTDGARALLSRGDGSSLDGRLDDAVDRVITDALIVSEGADWLPELDGPLLADVRDALSRFGTVDGPLELAWADDSPVVLALLEAQARERVRDLRQDTGVRSLIVGLDGADWQIIDPLIERGLLPNLEALRRRGAWGNIKALKPILSPLLWTSVATGVTPDRHGILDFLVRDPGTGEKVPVSSRFRKVRALWNIFDEAGLTSDVVAWWATWPAEPINGHVISDRVSYSLFHYEVPAAGAGATHPAGYFDRIRPHLVSDDSITYEEVARFADITPEEFERARSLIDEDASAAYEHPINHLTKILAATRNYHRINLDLLGNEQADLTAVYYQGIDEVCHRFTHFMPPRLEGVAAEDVRRYGRVVEQFYVWQDRLLGELLEAVDRETAVVVLSDHGFVNGPDRFAGETADVEGQPGKWHRPYGILLLAGPPIARRELDTSSLLDIHPTVLYLAGLPVPADADGRVLFEAVRPGFRERFEPSEIASYEITPYRSHAEAVPTAMAAADAEMLEKLRSLGYVGGEVADPSAGTETPASRETAGGVAEADTITAHANLASVRLAAGDLKGAEKEIEAALRMVPTFSVARRQLFDLRVRQQRYDEAIEIVEQLSSEPYPGGPLFLIRMAETYRAAGRADEGIRRFEDGVSAGRWQMGVPLSRLLLAGGDYDAADRVARAVLVHDPQNEPAMVTAFRAAEERGDVTSVLPLLEAALELNPRSVMHLNWAAVVHESTGDMARAETLLLAALEADPDHGGSMANLGGFHGRHGRTDKAVELLERALRIEPRNVEARVNLGSALARLDRIDEAIVEFEHAVENGHRSTGTYNALARAYGQRGNLATAVVWLGRSLELDPTQARVRESLSDLEARLSAKGPA